MPDQPKPRRRAPNKRQDSDAQAAERDERIWQLRLLGLSLRQIAAQVGLTHPRVLAILERGYRERVHPKVDEARTLELERLDDWMVRLAPAIRNGDDRAISTALRISERRARLLGMDAPTRVQAEVEDVTPPPDLLRRIEAAKVRAAERERQIRGGN